MNLGINGKCALVTGADSGIGLATAQALAAEGARVTITDVDQGLLDAAAKEFATEVGTYAADLTRTDEVEQLITHAQETMGGIDILVNCAGITGAQGDFHNIDDEGWMHTLDVNLMSAVRVVRAALPAMRQSGWGRIVLIASEDGAQPYVDELPYCASKAAIINLAKGLSKAYAADGILVNCVSPAFIETPMTDAMMDKRAMEMDTTFGEAVESFLKEERPTLDLQRRGQVDEVAAVIALLCSNRSSFVTGSNYRVDGGSVASI